MSTPTACCRRTHLRDGRSELFFEALLVDCCARLACEVGFNQLVGTRQAARVNSSKFGRYSFSSRISLATVPVSAPPSGLFRLDKLLSRAAQTLPVICPCRGRSPDRARRGFGDDSQGPKMVRPIGISAGPHRGLPCRRRCIAGPWCGTLRSTSHLKKLAREKRPTKHLLLLEGVFPISLGSAETRRLERSRIKTQNKGRMKWTAASF